MALSPSWRGAASHPAVTAMARPYARTNSPLAIKGGAA
jgi:hypothetical protein